MNSEMSDSVREFPWARTVLGAREAWPAALKTTVDLVLGSAFPMAVRWGPDLIQIYNDAYRPILGDKHPAALGRSVREVWPEIAHELGALHESILKGERGAFFAADHPWRVVRNGVAETARFTIGYSPVPDASAPHGIGGVLAVCVETTERVRKEQRLEEVTHSLEVEVARHVRERHRIWDVSDDLLGVATMDGYFNSVNPAWSQLLGWSEDEILATHVDELRHPDDAAEAHAQRARLLAGTSTVRMENRFRHKDGSWRWIQWTLSAYGGTIYMIGRHVTEEKKTAEALRESDRQLRLLVENVVDYALLMLDANGIVSSWNPGAQRIKGYQAHEIIGRHFSEFYTEEERQSGLPAKALATAAATGTYAAEGWRVRKDASVFWANVVIDAVYDENGVLIGFAKITRDITEQRNAQSALRLTQEQLLQAQKMEAIGQLTGGIAHDFNNLLMVVSGRAESLRQRLVDPKDVRAIEAIQMAASRGERLTRQLLAFSRRQALTPVAIDLDQRIEAFRDVLASSARRNIILTINIPPETWPVLLDVTELELALVNVIINARDAIEKSGRITISAENVRLERKDTVEGIEGEFVALHVTDTGRGISADVLQHIFEPFFTTKALGQGTGLGLSQVYGFTRQSGGTVAIKSEVGNGTTVTLYLPRTHRAIETVAAADMNPDARQDGGTILIVEDNAEIRAVARSLLEQLGYGVEETETAGEALARLNTADRISLVFSDVMLPGGLTGLQLAAEVEERFPDIPVLLTTGYAKALAEADSRFPLLRKPYQLSALADAVRRTMRAART
jgi:PAS domain S-box-containing protein